MGPNKSRVEPLQQGPATIARELGTGKIALRSQSDRVARRQASGEYARTYAFVKPFRSVALRKAVVNHGVGSKPREKARRTQSCRNLFSFHLTNEHRFQNISDRLAVLATVNRQITVTPISREKLYGTWDIKGTILSVFTAFHHNFISSLLVPIEFKENNFFFFFCSILTKYHLFQLFYNFMANGNYQYEIMVKNDNFFNY